MVLAFATYSSSPMQMSDLTNRYLWGPAVDMLLAEDQVSGAYSLDHSGSVSQDWKVTDQEHSVRAMVYRVSSTVVALGTVVQLDSFGNNLNASGDFEKMMFTGRFHDYEADLQWNERRKGVRHEWHLNKLKLP
jgi:hypothetical protein